MDVSEVMNTMGSSVNYFDPDGGDNFRLPEGIYKCHISKVSIIRDKTIKSKYKAHIYNLTVKLSDANKDTEYTVIDSMGNEKQVTGDTFADKEVRSMGVFNFIPPVDENSDWEANFRGNGKYLHLCKTVGAELPEIEIEIDGEKKKVSSLPNLEEEDLLGKPLIADVKFDKPYKNNEGKMITPLRVKSFSEWTDGQTQTDLVDDLPF